jgi:hypothetical protein
MYIHIPIFPHSLAYSFARSFTHSSTLIHIHTHSHSHSFTFTFIHIHTHSHSHTHTHTRTHIHLQSFTHSFIKWIRAGHASLRPCLIRRRRHGCHRQSSHLLLRHNIQKRTPRRIHHPQTFPLQPSRQESSRTRPRSCGKRVPRCQGCASSHSRPI